MSSFLLNTNLENWHKMRSTVHVFLGNLSSTDTLSHQIIRVRKSSDFKFWALESFKIFYLSQALFFISCNDKIHVLAWRFGTDPSQARKACLSPFSITESRTLQLRWLLNCSPSCTASVIKKDMSQQHFSCQKFPNRNADMVSGLKTGGWGRKGEIRPLLQRSCHENKWPWVLVAEIPSKSENTLLYEFRSLTVVVF